MIDEKNLKEMIKFCKIVGKLKKTKRTGWITRIGIKDPESVADHTFRTAVLAMLVADLKGMDTEKMMRMALLHDVGEAIIGDWDAIKTELEGRLEEKQRKENEALHEILSLLPKEIKDKYAKLWEEIVKRETPESKLLKELDKLEFLIQAAEYEKEGYDKEKLEFSWKNEKKNIKDSDLVKIVELLEKERS